MQDLRQACDRCHDKKLRCPKLPGSISCSRCTRANVPCVFSPPTRPLRPGAHGVSFDWSSFPALDHYQAEAWPEPPATPPRPTPDTQPSDPATTKLAESLVALDRIWRLLSSQGFHQGFQNLLRQRVDDVGCVADLHCTLEELPGLAQSLATLYPEILKLSVRDADVGEAKQTSERDAMHSNGTASRGSGPPSFDHAMLNLLLACHLRLLDVLDSLVVLVQICVNLTSALPADYDPKFDVPEIRIGSFIAPKNTAASIFLSTLLDLQALLVEKSRKLGAVFSSPGDGTALTREAKMIRLQCDILVDRADATLQEMKKLKDHLVSAGVMR